MPRARRHVNPATAFPPAHRSTDNVSTCLGSSGGFGPGSLQFAEFSRALGHFEKASPPLRAAQSSLDESRNEIDLVRNSADEAFFFLDVPSEGRFLLAKGRGLRLAKGCRLARGVQRSIGVRVVSIPDSVQGECLLEGIVVKGAGHAMDFRGGGTDLMSDRSPRGSRRRHLFDNGARSGKG